MRGLIAKDLRLTLTRKQTLVMFLALAIIMGVTVDGSFLVAFLAMLAVIVAISTISYDEYDNGFAFLMTLPFDRKTYVREKYLFGLGAAVAAWCIGALVYAIVSLVRHDGAALVEELPALTAIIPVMYLTAAVMIPVQLKYGSEKSRIMLFVVFGVIAVLVFVGSRVFGESPALAELVNTLESLSPAVVLLALVAVCVLAAFAFYLWSVRIMEKKEF